MGFPPGNFQPQIQMPDPNYSFLQGPQMPQNMQNQQFYGNPNPNIHYSYSAIPMFQNQQQQQQQQQQVTQQQIKN